MANGVISQLTVPIPNSTGTATYEIKDAWARERLENLGSLEFIGVTTTALTDGDTSHTTYQQLAGINKPADVGWTDYFRNGTVVIYNNDEFICTTVTSGSSTTVTWHKFGSAVSTTTAAVLGEDTTFGESHSWSGTYAGASFATYEGLRIVTGASSDASSYDKKYQIPQPTFSTVVSDITFNDTATGGQKFISAVTTANVVSGLTPSSNYAVTEIGVYGDSQGSGDFKIITSTDTSAFVTNVSGTTSDSYIKTLTGGNSSGDIKYVQTANSVPSGAISSLSATPPTASFLTGVTLNTNYLVTKNITVVTTPANSSTIYSISSVGTLPTSASWSATYTSATEDLAFSFTPNGVGTLPTRSSCAVYLTSAFGSSQVATGATSASDANGAPVGTSITPSSATALTGFGIPSYTDVITSVTEKYLTKGTGYPLTGVSKNTASAVTGGTEKWLHASTSQFLTGVSPATKTVVATATPTYIHVTKDASGAPGSEAWLLISKATAVTGQGTVDFTATVTANKDDVVNAVTSVS